MSVKLQAKDEQFTRLQMLLKLQYRVTPPVGAEIYPKLQKCCRKNSHVHSLWRLNEIHPAEWCNSTDRHRITTVWYNQYTPQHATYVVSSASMCIIFTASAIWEDKLTSVAGCLSVHAHRPASAYSEEQRINIIPGLYSVAILPSFVKIFPYECHWLESRILAVAYLTKTNQAAFFCCHFELPVPILFYLSPSFPFNRVSI